MTAMLKMIMVIMLKIDLGKKMFSQWYDILLVMHFKYIP